MSCRTKNNFLTCWRPNPLVFYAVPSTKGTLKIVKVATFNDATFRFSISPSIGEASTVSITTVNGMGFVDVPNLNSGSYSITEIPQTGWTGTTNVVVDVPGGSTGTATFYNTNRGTLIIEKTAMGHDGVFQFSITPPAGGISNTQVSTSSGRGSMTINGVLPGNYIVRELQQVGWTGSTETLVTVPLGGIGIAPFLNAQLGTLIIEKQSIGNNGTFDFAINPPAGGISLTSITTKATGTMESVVITNVNPGDYTITELGQTGWTGDGSRFTIVPAGATSTVSFINTLQTGTLVINKTSIGGTGSFTFTITNPFGKTASVTAETTGTSNTGTVKIIVPNVTVGGYNVVEEDNIGWQGDTGGLVSVSPGQTGTINFVNNRLGTLLIHVESIGGTDFFDFDITLPSGDEKSARFQTVYPGMGSSEDNIIKNVNTGAASYDFILENMPLGLYSVKEGHYDRWILEANPVTGTLSPGSILRLDFINTK